MNKFERGDLVKAFIGASVAYAAPAAVVSADSALAADQYWYAYYDKSIGLVVKVNADHVWVRWCGLRSDNANHVYFNDIKYFELVSQIDHE